MREPSQLAEAVAFHQLKQEGLAKISDTLVALKALALDHRAHCHSNRPKSQSLNVQSADAPGPHFPGEHGAALPLMSQAGCPIDTCSLAPGQGLPPLGPQGSSALLPETSGLEAQLPSSGRDTGHRARPAPRLEHPGTSAGRRPAAR